MTIPFPFPFGYALSWGLAALIAGSLTSGVAGNTGEVPDMIPIVILVVLLAWAIHAVTLWVLRSVWRPANPRSTRCGRVSL